MADGSHAYSKGELKGRSGRAKAAWAGGLLVQRRSIPRLLPLVARHRETLAGLLHQIPLLPLGLAQMQQTRISPMVLRCPFFLLRRRSCHRSIASLNQSKQHLSAHGSTAHMQRSRRLRADTTRSLQASFNYRSERRLLG